MTYLYQFLFFIGTFFIMEFMAWLTHKYVMHGFLWSLHKDHHHKHHDSWFERNDAFFIFYALVSIGCFLLWKYGIFCLWIVGWCWHLWLWIDIFFGARYIYSPAF